MGLLAFVQLRNPRPQEFYALQPFLYAALDGDQAITRLTQRVLILDDAGGQGTQEGIGAGDLGGQDGKSLRCGRLVRAALLQLGVIARVLHQRVVDLQLLQSLGVLQIVAGLAGLQLHAAQAFRDLLDDVRQAKQVLLGPRQLAQGLFLVGLVPADPGGLFEDGPAIRLGRAQHLVDLPLFDDGIGHGADAGVHEHLAEVSQPTRLPVNAILAVAAAIHFSRNLHFIGINGELPRSALLRIGKDQRHFGRPQGLSAAAAAENDVDHLVAAEALHLLLAQDPLHAVHDVALATAVGAYNDRHRSIDGKLCLVGEALETVKNHLFQSHDIPWPLQAVYSWYYRPDVARILRNRSFWQRSCPQFSLHTPLIAQFPDQGNGVCIGNAEAPARTAL